ncbi:MAG: hypothetical protein WCV79_01420 [Candidatus Paceibacterota bacterium]
MKKSFYYRIFADILVVIFLIQGWWFVALPVLLIGAWSFPFYFELILAGIFYDSLFGMAGAQGIYGYVGTIVTSVFFIVIFFAKRIVRR